MLALVTFTSLQRGGKTRYISRGRSYSGPVHASIWALSSHGMTSGGVKDKVVPW